MVSIRGPKSALSDFIQENDIKLTNIQIIEPRPEKPVQMKKQKRIKKKPDTELVNLYTQLPSLQDMSIRQLLSELTINKYTDSQLKLISQYLGRERMMNEYYFKFLLENCTEELYIYDCSMIKDHLFQIEKKIKILEMHYCGQLTENTLNRNLNNLLQLEKLTLNGAFLIDEMILPQNVRYLDLTDCSRLKNSFINRLNKLENGLDFLRLSKCYGFDENAELMINVNELFICETNLSYKFFQNIPNLYDIKSLSFSKCPNLFITKEEVNVDFSQFTKLEYLDIEGIKTITKLDLPICMNHLNIAHCYDFEIRSIFKNKNLKYLNVGRINLCQDDLNSLINFTELETLILSWSEHLTDEILELILSKLENLQLVHVFGCFNLTERAGQLAWAKKNTVKIIGNPCETRFLLNK